jgi:hypothetical protein
LGDEISLGLGGGCGLRFCDADGTEIRRPARLRVASLAGRLSRPCFSFERGAVDAQVIDAEPGRREPDGIEGLRLDLRAKIKRGGPTVTCAR